MSLNILVDNVDNPTSLSSLTEPFNIPRGISASLDIWSNGNLELAKKHFQAQMKTLIDIVEKKKFENVSFALKLDIDSSLCQKMRNYTNDLKVGELKIFGVERDEFLMIYENNLEEPKSKM